jgi:hypothetical protein
MVQLKTYTILSIIATFIVTLSAWQRNGTLWLQTLLEANKIGILVLGIHILSA